MSDLRENLLRYLFFLALVVLLAYLFGRDAFDLVMAFFDLRGGER